MKMPLLFFVVLFAGLLVLPFVLLFRPKFVGSRWGLLWGIAAIATALAVIAYETNEVRRSISPAMAIYFASRGLIIVLGTSFALRMHSKWIAGKLTEDEKLPTGQGVRTWLGIGNIFLVLTISLCAWQGFNYSFWAILVLLTGLVVAYPVIRLISQPGEFAQAGPAQNFCSSAAAYQPAEVKSCPDLTVERDRVLKMLEAGKISPDEASELLSALGDSAPTPPPVQTRPTMPIGQKVTIVGAGLVLLGFFLPWLSINPGKEMNRMLNNLATQMPQNFPSQVKFTAPTSPNILYTEENVIQGKSKHAPALKTGSIQLTGADIQNGLGFMIILIAISVAILPFLATNIPPAKLAKISLCILALGGLLIVYILAGNFRHASFGLAVVTAGYILECVGLFRTRRDLKIPEPLTSQAA